MRNGHGHTLHYEADSRVHRVPGHAKILGLLIFMLVVVATPGRWYATFGVYLALLLVVVAASRVPVIHLLPRMIVAVPFVVFAALVPFLATGPRTELLGVTLSAPGLAPPGRCSRRPPSVCSPV